MNIYQIKKLKVFFFQNAKLFVYLDLHAENQTPNKTITLVVSIDQAGTIKLRKRKKSKRRKKKSRSGDLCFY